MPLDRDQLNRIIEFLVPHVNTPEADRKAFILRAFYGEPVVEQLTYGGQAVTFAVNCISQLRTYNGEAAIVQLLTLLRDHYVGVDRAREIDVVIAALTISTSTVGATHKDVVPPLTLDSHLFISYARKDLTFVNRLREDLHKRSIPYWIDTEGLSPGTLNWERAIRTAIEGSSAVLWIVSPAAYESDYVTSEIAVAEMHKRRIYPVWADGENWIACVPLGRHHIQYVDMRGSAYAAGLEQLLAALGKSTSELVVPLETTPVITASDLPPRNPYKGLNAFREDDVDDFFGRESLVRSLVARLDRQLMEGKDRFLAVLGPSGAGKSSVVMAGVIPVLRKNDIAGSEGWRYLPTITLGVHPMERFAAAFAMLTPSLDATTVLTRLYMMGLNYLNIALEMLPAPYVVVYIDQFEELFTLTESDTERQQFIDLLTGAVSEPNGKLIVLVSMRADFLNYALNNPQLGKLFRDYSEMVQSMSIAELREAIEHPARLPGVALSFDDGLVSDIVFALRGTNTALSGALPLLQFTLERLYAERDGRRLTRAAYERIGGVAGAIGIHSEAVFAALPEVAQAKLGSVLLPLVNIDESSGEATRRRAPLEPITADVDSKSLVDAFVNNGLLQRGRDEDGDGRYLEVSHEALFRSWERLKTLIAEMKEDLILLRQMRTAAHDWQMRREREPGRDLDYLRWPAERLTLVYTMQERLKPELNESEWEFIEPEQARLLRELDKRETSHERRRDIGDRLAKIGDDRVGIGLKNDIPNIAWLPVEVPNSPVSLKTSDAKLGPVTLQPFFIAKFQITYSQFEAFLEADDGFSDERWWIDIPNSYKHQQVHRQRIRIANAPRDSISWYQCVAFARWLNNRLKSLELQHPSGKMMRVGHTAEVRLPLEWEWQWAAQHGDQNLQYPWGNWENNRANTSEAGIGRTTAVGMYPDGAAYCGALDMSGNLWEWCQNDRDVDRSAGSLGIKDSKVLRGGAYYTDHRYAACNYRHAIAPPQLGFERCVCQLELKSIGTSAIKEKIGRQDSNIS
jgi:formylglycine-generating enzyme required for sulfatase activity